MDFVKNMKMIHIVGGGGGGHVICIIMTHCVRKSICDNTFVAIEKMEPHNYD